MGTHGATKSATSAVPTPRSNSMAMVRLAIGLLGVCAVVAAFGLVSGARRYAEAGNPYPGASSASPSRSGSSPRRWPVRCVWAR